jgi:DNA polymerase-3 subunit epsilon
MKQLSLRVRIFLFFCLAALGSLAILVLALWWGYRQIGDAAALSAFINTGFIAGLGITGLIVFIWLKFDENVSKPIESVAASLRVRAHVDVTTPIDVATSQYLGDLAPAASAMGSVLDNLMKARSKKTDQSLEALELQRDQLVGILSDIPVATILVSADHQIVLYDGQAAALMERDGIAKLKTSVFDYIEKSAVLTALEQLNDGDAVRMPITVSGHCGDVHTGFIRSFGPDKGYTLMLEPDEDVHAARPLTYDFDILTRSNDAELVDTPLRDLVYVVFDSETTGLDPAKDEVVQLGAVRVVNGGIVVGEVFDTLVNPGLTIPSRSTEVHGVTNEMVANAPTFDQVCPQFHAFASQSVLVAHNAPFDMAFLHKQAKSSGAVFDHPVCDTVLMSAAIFGGSAVHTLDAICERLAITIPDELRHTAMGDAVATAQALVAMIPICEGRGFVTFGDLRRETDKHLRILKG